MQRKRGHLLAREVETTGIERTATIVRQGIVQIKPVFGVFEAIEDFAIASVWRRVLVQGTMVSGRGEKQV
ncbi:hypothetical protein L6452_31276 [Arctium lappa]|uniref:Uncharacterized protein n=1 Tax=Arctium lappa TaxID=4217 RepID=A0ACB8ZKD2_ARCLA|nr:hypothetical protein L6452_31276 [Arctium lappa]